MTASDERGPKVSWDRSAQRETTSALAVARARGDHVEIDFGERVNNQQGPAIGAKLVRRIALRPVAAKRLCEMLERLVAETAISAAGKS